MDRARTRLAAHGEVQSLETVSNHWPAQCTRSGVQSLRSPDGKSVCRTHHRVRLWRRGLASGDGSHRWSVWNGLQWVAVGNRPDHPEITESRRFPSFEPGATVVGISDVHLDKFHFFPVHHAPLLPRDTFLPPPALVVLTSLFPESRPEIARGNVLPVHSLRVFLP